MELPDENEYRFVAVLNRKIDTGKLTNALGHMCAGLAGGYGRASEMQFLSYRDHDGGIHPHISHYAFIVLAAENSGQIRKIRLIAQAQGILFTDFTSTMTVGTTRKQQELTAVTPEAELEYYGICMFGKTSDLKNLTKNFSLYHT